MQHPLFTLLAGRRGHFQMESGYHSEAWFELDQLFAKPDQLRPFVRELAQRLARHRPDALCGPMTGGATLADMLGNELGVPAFAAARLAPRESSTLFPVKYQLAPEVRGAVNAKRIAIVDDAISAGSAVRGTRADLIACGAQPVVLGALIVFGETIGPYAQEHALAVEAVARTSFALWPPETCPLCRAGTPLERASDAPKK